MTSMNSSNSTKQGERFTLSEPARREVLDRLLALNHQRHAEELAAGLHEEKSKRNTKNCATKRTKKKATPTSQQELF